MKMLIALLLIFLTASCAHSEQKNYTGSTPADMVVRIFFDMPLHDSIDFIRWQLSIDDNIYRLQCNYGISKPNTNGFMQGGKTISLTGKITKDKNVYNLHNENKTLQLAELNTDLLHVMDASHHLLGGNGGWSYTLSNLKATKTDQLNFFSQQGFIKDSIAYEGRTPCGVPGIIPEGMTCYKLKWYLVLYSDAPASESGNYKLFGTPYRKEGGRKGQWQIIHGKDERIIYQLINEQGKGFIYLVKTGNDILLFTDTSGKLLVGDHDFGYTLNKVESTINN